MLLQNHFYVMRHGQSENNVLGIESCLINTQDQFGLTDLGRSQVQSAAHSAPQFDVIYSSPFRRAQETAQIMAASQSLDVRTENRLIEFKLPSQYDQQPYELAEKMIHDPFTDLNTTPIEDSESFFQMYKRLEAALQDLDQQHQNSTVLLVTHGSPVEALIQIIKGVCTGFGPFEALPQNAELIHLNTIGLIA